MKVFFAREILLVFFTLLITNIHSRAQSTVNVTFSINQPPIPLTVDAGPDQFYEGTPLTLSATASGAGDEFFFYWYPEGYLDDPFSPNPVVSGLEVPTFFYVSVFSDTGYVCDARDSVFVDMETSGLDDLNEIQVKAYPNPFDEVIHFESTRQITSISITNSAGQLVYYLNENNMDLAVLNTSSLGVGFYVFSVTFVDGIEKKMKLCKLK